MKAAAAAYSAGLLLFGAAVTWSYFSTTLQAGLLATALLAGFAALAAGAGRTVLARLSLGELGALERSVIGASLGLGILSTLIFALAAAGGLRSWAVALVLAALAAASFSELRSMAEALAAGRRGAGAGATPILPGCVGIALGLAFWTAWVPPHQYDALVYHLPLPAAYLRSGGLTVVPHLIYSHFPQNAEMLFALGLLTGSDLLPQLFSWLATALSVAWLYSESKGRMPKGAAWLACLVAATHSSVMLLAATAYVEAFVMLWITAALFCWLRGSEAPENGRKDAWMALAGVFAGLAIGTKYTAGVCAAFLALFSFARWLRAKCSAREWLVFGVAAALAGSPWLVKNWIVLGNPVFPFLFKALPHRGVPWGTENASRYFNFLTEYGHAKGRFLADILLVHYRAAFGAVNLGGGMDVIGTLGWAAIFALVPAAVWACWKERGLRWLGLYALLHWAAWFSSVVVLRYLTALVPVVAFLGAAGFWRLREASGRAVRGALGLGLGLLLACNAALFLSVHTMVTSWKPLLGLESHDEFLSRMLDYYPCARWAGEHLPEEGRVLLVGEQRSFYVSQNAVATTPMAPNRFVEWANESASSEQLAKRLRSEGGFDAVLVVPREAQRLGLYGVFAFTDVGKKNWDGLEGRYLKPIYRAPACAVLGFGS